MLFSRPILSFDFGDDGCVEEVYLYRTNATPAGARLVFLDHGRRVNRLREHPSGTTC